MIITVAPCPAIEYLYEVDALNINKDMEATNTKINILSKGIHSAEVIKILQDEAMVLSLLGGFAGRYIKHHMDKSKIKSDIVWCDGETPHKMKISSSDTEDHYRVTRQNWALTEKEINKLEQKLKNYYKNISTMILTGYLPEQFNPDFYGNLIKDSKSYNIRAILSVGQIDVLNAAMAQKPYALMFTKKQLTALGIDISSRESIIAAMETYLLQGVHYVVVDLKDEGSLMLSKNKRCYVEPLTSTTTICNTASSGAFLGALAIGIQRKYEQEKIAKLITAAARATHQTENLPLCTKKDIDMFVKKVKVRELVSVRK